MSGVSGNFAGLGHLIIKLEKVCQGDAFKSAGRAIAASIQDELHAGFDGGFGPDGSAWAPLRFGGGSPLKSLGDRATAKLIGSNTVRATVAFKWAGVHQRGATIRPLTEGVSSNWHGRNGKLKHDPGRATKRGGVLVFSAGGGKVFTTRVVIPARPMLPADGSMPGRWINPAQEAARRIVLAWFN